MMNKLKKFASIRQLKPLVSIVIVGILLILNVACSSPDVPMSSSTESYDEQVETQTDLYNTTQPKRDGMNGYDDDVRYENPAVKAKSRALVDNAKRNIGQREDPKEIPTKVLNSADNLKDEISESVQQGKESFVTGTQEGMRNLKDNLDQASREVPEVLKEGTENAKNSMKRSANSVQEAVGTLKQNLEAL